MDGKRIQEYLSHEISALLQIYKQFQTLLPRENQDSAYHKGEDGRYVESLVKECLKKYLPQNLEVLTGFILRPAVKTGKNNKVRKSEKDSHSSQLDIIIYDSANYPVFQRFGDNVIVPPEGVVAIISVKKKFNDADYVNECSALKTASKLCSHEYENGKLIRGPFLALIAMDSKDKVRTLLQNWIFSKIGPVYDPTNDTFDNTIGLITNLGDWSIFKRRPIKSQNQAEYIYFKHKENEKHLGFQFLITGILSAYYDETRNRRERPGFTGFPSGRKPDQVLGKIKIYQIR